MSLPHDPQPEYSSCLRAICGVIRGFFIGRSLLPPNNSGARPLRAPARGVPLQLGVARARPHTRSSTGYGQNPTGEFVGAVGSPASRSAPRLARGGAVGADARRALPAESRCRTGCGVALRFTEPTRRAARHARPAGARPHPHASPFYIDERTESCGHAGKMSAVNDPKHCAHILGLRSGPPVFLSFLVRPAAPLICGDPGEISPWNGQLYEKATEIH